MSFLFEEEELSSEKQQINHVWNNERCRMPSPPHMALDC